MLLPLTPRTTAFATIRLDLDPLELEAAIVAIHDRGDVAPADERARLERARIALELELARALEQ